VALATLYQSTARPADAHAVLAPALDGFAPTPEMPEIAEAQSLLAALALAKLYRPPALRRRTRSSRRRSMALRRRRKCPRSPRPRRC
jgi:hypothetical protein